NVYFFKEELPVGVKDNPESLPKHVPEWLVWSLARELGRILDGCEQLRVRAAAAVLRFRLHEQTLPGLTDFDTIKRVVMECLEAHSCSLFGRDRSGAGDGGGTDRAVSVTGGEAPPRLGVLRFLATTGLQREDGTPADRAEVSYDLDKDRDIGL